MSIVGAFSKNTYTLAQAFGAADITTEKMKLAISEWFGQYYGDNLPDNEDGCQQIPYTIVRKLVKTAFGEYSANTEDEYAESVIESLDGIKADALGKALIGGTALLKPIPQPDGWAWNVIPRTNYLVFGRDVKGNLTDIGTIERLAAGGGFYTLLERRTVQNGFLTIKNTLYKSVIENQLGSIVPLNTLSRYADLPDEYTYSKPIGLGLVEVSVDMANCVDGSADSVSVYAPAIGLIHNININEKQLNTEFQNGKSRLGVSADLASGYSLAPSSCESQNESGFVNMQRKIRKQFDDDVFTLIDDDPQNVGFVPFSPALREQSFLARKKEYLRNIESMIGIKRGLLSEVDSEYRTAKEVTSSEGDYALTIIDIQKIWENALYDAIKLCGTLGVIYKVPGAHDIKKETVSIDWGDGILYDEDKAWQNYLDMVARGMLKPEYALGWRFNMPTDTPEDLSAIRKKYMPEIDKLLGGIE